MDSISTRQLPEILGSIERDPIRRCAYVFLRAFVNWCYRREYVHISPIARLEVPSPIKARVHVPTPAEIGRIWHACPLNEYGRIVKLCIVSAQRIGMWIHYRPVEPVIARYRGVMKHPCFRGDAGVR
jgi:integrase